MTLQFHSPPLPHSHSSTTFHYLLPTLLFSLLFLLYLSHTPLSPSSPSLDPFLFPHLSRPHTHRLLFLSHRRPSLPSPPPPPSLAYFISGSKGDSARILRLLFAVYHPRNHYLIHLDLGAAQSEREEMARVVMGVGVFRAAQNVNVLGKADFSYDQGASAISAVLHGASVLLRLSERWDWFVNLSPAHYPLVTQDDLLHILSYLPKDLNFINHTSYIGWRESRKLKPIIVDPGLYLSEINAMFYATQKRDLPDAYQLFTGYVLLIHVYMLMRQKLEPAKL